MNAPDNNKSRQFDLEERTLSFARNVRVFVRNLVKDELNIDDIRQVIRASGSVGANYIEANEALSKKDFRMRIKISRKEAKESAYWLKLLKTGALPEIEHERVALLQEAQELTNIFGAILRNSEKRND